MPPKQVPSPKPKPAGYRKRSKPPDTVAILGDLAKRLPPDAETPESVARRNARYAPPRQTGARVGGRRMDNPPV